jgi:hypothetical protein
LENHKIVFLKADGEQNYISHYENSGEKSTQKNSVIKIIEGSKKEA